MLTALTALYLAQIIDIKEALAGFSSSGLLTVLVLFVVAEGLNKTGALNWYVGKLFGRPSTPAGAQIRVMAPIMALSGFINDTPLVTIALPVLIQWAGRVKVPLRLILIPLSFAALLGGVFTIIGTSTNLIVVGLLLDAYPNEERYTNLSLFALTPYGVPVGFIGMAYVILMSPLLLMRKDQGVIASSSEDDILLGARLTQWSPAAGRSIKRSGLRDTGGIYLVSVMRKATGNVHTAVSPDFVLEVGDLLWFSGSATSVGNLRKIPGLSLLESDEVMKMGEKAQDRRLVEAVVSRNGPLVGKTVKELKFRSTYGAAVIAVHREGRRVHELPGNIKLQAGDVLLLEAGKSFLVANKNRYDTGFTLVAEVENSSPPRFRMLIPAVILTVGAYVCYMLKLSSLFGTAMTAAILMVACGVLSEAEARSAIQWQIYLTIAPAFGVGQALINSGVAAAIASFLVKVGTAMGIGSAGLLGAVYLATVLMSQVVANNAAAALIFPIAMDAAARGGIDPLLMAFSIMLAASAAFMTPFGYQTNLMVMGHGGYSTGDFLIFGTPMQIVLLFVSTVALVVPAWWLVWLISFAVLVLVCVFRVLQDRKKIRSKST
eukprot:CCRYP_016753-RE/>CCRYP_016753-RE protein AED:0.30 eAED:0.30 QI:0/0.66/0.5/1/0.33/0/4/153/602